MENVPHFWKLVEIEPSRGMASKKIDLSILFYCVPNVLCKSLFLFPRIIWYDTIMRCIQTKEIFFFLIIFFSDNRRSYKSLWKKHFF